MGLGFVLESNDNEMLLQNLESARLSKNWRGCCGVGCYSLLQSLLGPTYCYEMTIQLETIKKFYECVNYFIVNKSVCDISLIPNWRKESLKYEENINTLIEVNDYTLNQAKNVFKMATNWN